METLAYYIVQALCSLLMALYYYRCAKEDQDRKAQSSLQKQQKYSNTYLTDPRNRELQAQLLQMLQGDVSTAKKLLLEQRRVFPGKHDNWYLEKVIYNLEQTIDKIKIRDSEMYSRLRGMLQGDDTAAHRLLMQQIETCPGKQYGWYLEKVIYDLERDRR
ncbi:hypothetical protein [uncultured Nostoc sp.]|uniref:hypothetical protein n=1 Tax=uncultured Nostoc sp. TaxID=340711 RepID=UPI0035C9E79B